MGVSTDAILFYGFCFDEEDTIFGQHVPWDTAGEDLDEEQWIAGKLGVEYPCFPYPPIEDASSEANDARDAYSVYFKAKREAMAASDIEIVHHCSGECTMYGIALKESVVTARRGYPKTLDIENCIVLPPSANTRILTFCEKIGWNVGSHQIGWWLVSMWN